jgi:cell division protein FtsN
LAQKKTMRIPLLIPFLMTAALVSGCSALPFGHKSKSKPAALAAGEQGLDPGLKVAVDVVMARLRDADGKDRQTVEAASPQIFQLAAALMPPTGGGRTSFSRSEPRHEPQAQTYTQAQALPQTLGDLQRMGNKAASAAYIPNAHGGAQVQNASYNRNDFASAPNIPEARSLMHAIHLGSYRTSSRAMQGYGELKTRIPEALTGLRPRVERVDLGQKGIFQRLKAGPFASRADAMRACAQIKNAGLYCVPSDFTGKDAG